MALPRPDPPHRELYRWQLDALISWLRCGRRGVIEAVTGSGKTDVAIAAVSDALRRGRFVLIVVPSRVLMEQWHGRLTAAFPEVCCRRMTAAASSPAGAAAGAWSCGCGSVSVEVGIRSRTSPP